MARIPQKLKVENFFEISVDLREGADVLVLVMTILVTHKNAPLRPDQTFVFDKDMDTTILTTNDILDTVFRQCNHVDNTEWIASKKLRSMSVGDEILLVEGSLVEKYLVAGCGFHRLQ